MSAKLIGLVISALSLAGFVYWASRQDAPHFPTAAGDLAWVGAALGLYALATVLRGWRWHHVLRGAGIEHSLADAQALTVVGYMGNTVLPARGGEVARVVLMARRSSGGHREVIGSVVAERALDVVALALLLAGLTFAGAGGVPTGDAVAVSAIGGCVAAAGALAGYFWLRRRGRFERLASTIRPFARAARGLLSVRGARLLAVTLAVWGIEGLVFASVGESLGLDVSVAEGLVLVVASSFFALIPSAPGYVGTFDAAVAFVLEALGVAGAGALSFVLLVRFVMFVPITVVGLIIVVVRYGGLATLRPARVATA